MPSAHRAHLTLRIYTAHLYSYLPSYSPYESVPSNHSLYTAISSPYRWPSALGGYLSTRVARGSVRKKVRPKNDSRTTMILRNPYKCCSIFRRAHRLRCVLHHRRCSSQRPWLAKPRGGHLDKVITYVRKHFRRRRFALNCINSVPSQLESRPFTAAAPSSLCLEGPIFNAKLCAGVAPTSADAHVMA